LHEQLTTLKGNQKRLGAIVFIYLSGISTITVYGIWSGPLGGFLTPGGIAQIPIGITAFTFGIAITLMCRTNCNRNEDHTLRFFFFGSIVICLLGVFYAYSKTSTPGQFWTVPYYPAKMTITILLIVLAFLIGIVFSDEGSQSHDSGGRFVSQILVCGSVIALIAWNSYSWQFQNGYMGNTEGVIKSLMENESEALDVDSVLEMVSKNLKEERSILYLSETYDGELNTRWINSLSMNWTDENWAAWQVIRQTIESGNAPKPQILPLEHFLVVTDDYEIFDKYKLDRFEFESFCFFDDSHNLVCR
jgi:hypothetical protein